MGRYLNSDSYGTNCLKDLQFPKRGFEKNIFLRAIDARSMDFYTIFLRAITKDHLYSDFHKTHYFQDHQGYGS